MLNMLYWIIYKIFTIYNIKQTMVCSLSFRSSCIFFSSLFISLGISTFVINWLHSQRVLQIIRSNGPKSHIYKKNVPTMGGLIILISIVTSILLWADLSNLYVWYVLFILVAYGILGFIDDLLKIKRKNSVGLSLYHKYMWQSLIALCLIAIILFFSRYSICFQFFGFFQKDSNIIWNIWRILFSYFVIVGTSNGVNLNDGLDGLAIVSVMFVAFGLSVIAWVTSNVFFAHYLNISYVYYVKELVVVCVSIIGSGLGFLWFNTHPAQIFMGDVGSLSLGGAIAIISILLSQEFLLFIMGGIFVIEVVSVILQVIFFKFFNKRVLKMAPIHHHFELKGYPEFKITVRFWIISFILMFLGLIFFRIL